MARDDYGRNEERVKRLQSDDSDRHDREHNRGGGTRNNRDDYYGNRASEGARDDSHQGSRFGQGESESRRGERGTSGSEGGRGFGAPWSPNRGRGNSEYDHGAFDEGQPTDRSYGQGMYNQNVGQDGQESYGQGRGSGDWGSHARGSEGGAARGDRFGNTRGESYGGGGQHGGSRGMQGSFESGAGAGAGSQETSRNRGHAGRGPKGWKRSDERIRDDVSEQLERHHEIDASDIEVRVEQGEVILSGTVDDRRTKRLAEDIVEAVSGVQDVQNQIRVKRDGGRPTQGSGTGMTGEMTGGVANATGSNGGSATVANAGNSSGGQTADQAEGRSRKPS